MNDSMGNEIKGIKCEVTTCVYHDKSDCCTAGQIQVGCKDADSCRDTMCETFKLADGCKSCR